MNRLFKIIVGWFYPHRCAFCNKIIPQENLVCQECSLKTSKIYTTKTVLKGSFCVSPFRYVDIYKGAVKNLKFGKNKYYADTMAYYIVASIREHYNTDMFSCVTAVPLTKKQLKKYGFNHAEELGKAVAKLIDVPYKNLLVKVKENKSQRRLSKQERIENVKGVYQASDEIVTSEIVLLIDDVTTTGATLGECCKVLKKNKNQTYCATFCKT